MRKWLKNHFQHMLERFARVTIQRYHPLIIGIAGSVGKTSTKEAAFHVLSRKYRVRKSTKSYNNEFGVPLTVLGLESGYTSIFSWIKIFFAGRRIAYGKSLTYPQCLMLEMGTDHVGDIEKLMSVARPTIGVLTGVAPVHLEYFGSFEHVKKEESAIIRLLGEGGKGIINTDDADAREAVADITRPLLTYGEAEGSTVRASEVQLSNKDKSYGLRFTLTIGTNSCEVFCKGAISRPHLSAILGAACIGHALAIPFDEIVAGIESFEPAPGRMRLIEGIKRTWLIDDTYNSSPKAAKSALDVLKTFPHARHKIAVLGDMAELGSHTELLHREVGAYVYAHADILITVGEKARDIARGARSAGMDESSVFEFAQHREAGLFLQDRIHEGDVVLIKGSQISRLEKIVREVMAEPQKAEALLVRQETYWKPQS